MKKKKKIQGMGVLGKTKVKSKTTDKNWIKKD